VASYRSLQVSSGARGIRTHHCTGFGPAASTVGLQRRGARLGANPLHATRACALPGRFVYSPAAAGPANLTRKAKESNPQVSPWHSFLDCLRTIPRRLPCVPVCARPGTTPTFHSRSCLHVPSEASLARKDSNLHLYALTVRCPAVGRLAIDLVPPGGIEPPTRYLKGSCSAD